YPRRLNPPQPGELMPSVDVVFWAPEVNARATPSILIVAENGPVPRPSTRRSNLWPAKNRAPSGGVTDTLVGSAYELPDSPSIAVAVRKDNRNILLIKKSISALLLLILTNRCSRQPNDKCSLRNSFPRSSSVVGTW